MKTRTKDTTRTNKCLFVSVFFCTQNDAINAKIPLGIKNQRRKCFAACFDPLLSKTNSGETLKFTLRTNIDSSRILNRMITGNATIDIFPVNFRLLLAVYERLASFPSAYWDT